MSKQIVISGTRILAHGEGCFLAMGGTVICPESGRIYQNATIATVDNLPADIDRVGYEYHAGEFVPCAPFGVGAGNLAVFCGEDCKALKDSGIPMGNFARWGVLTYAGADKKSKGIAADGFQPKIVIIVAQTSNYTYHYSGFIVGNYGISIPAPSSGGGSIEVLSVTQASDNVVSWSSSTAAGALNASGVTYTAFFAG